MDTRDLYVEIQCPRCGNRHVKAATFCPHCGYVYRSSWWDRLKDLFGGGGETTRTPASTTALVSTLIGFGIAGYLIFQAIQRQSIISAIYALLVLIFAFRSLFGSRQTGVEREGETGDVGSQEEAGVEEELEADHYFCENCGKEVAADALVCPSCGHSFSVDHPEKPMK
jgi:ribosomal protein L37E